MAVDCLRSFLCQPLETAPPHLDGSGKVEIIFERFEVYVT